MTPAPKRLLLVNPTRYLGNLLIAGGLVQDLAAQCRSRGGELGVVLDTRYLPLLGEAFAGCHIIPYERSLIARGGWQGWSAWLRCLRELRAWRADLAFNIEEDATSHHLTQLSGAAFRLGCSLKRHRFGYHAVVPIDFEASPEGRPHRWHQYEDVFIRAGLAPCSERQPGYVRLAVPPLGARQRELLAARGLDPERPFAVLHVSATKEYKLWPASHFARLAALLDAEGYQIALIGAGADAVNISQVLAQLEPPLAARVCNLLNALPLDGLAALLGRASLVVGNDSGPLHLAGALGARGAMIFGPTRSDLWGPLSPRIRLLQDRSVCAADCSRRHCSRGRACLAAITVENAVASLTSIPC